jgi:membrane protein DedA with SNARE-associated domain
MQPARSRRAWTAFSVIGIALWIGITVLVGVVADDPTDPKPTLIAFIGGGAVFFGLMFGFALVEQLRWSAKTPESRFGRRVAIGYTLAGITVTALGLAGMWAGGVEDVDSRLFYYPLVAIVVLWAGVALWLLRHYRQG